MNGEALHTSPIAGKVFVLVGAGGAGRALAYGAKSRGARVVIFNRDYGNDMLYLIFRSQRNYGLIYNNLISLFDRESKISCTCRVRGSSTI